MQIYSDLSKDHSHDKPDPGSYEWWYFDAISADSEYSVVVIFYEGNPFSRRYIDATEKGNKAEAKDYPAVSISVYKNGQTIFYSFEEVLPEHAKFSNARPEGEVKKCRFLGEQFDDRTMTYILELRQKLPNGDALNGELHFNSVSQHLFDSKEGEGQHTWNLIQPDAHVTCELSITGYKNEQIRFEGRGYHDHNLGLEPMKDSFDEWYWGRFHTGDYTLIYYLMNEKGKFQNRAWLLHPSHPVRDISGTLSLDDQSVNIFGLSSAHKIEMKNGDERFMIQQQTLLDDGPFYRRFLSRLILNMDGELHQTTGISEYIHPARIHARVYRPLVNMRIRYPDKVHWVQKNPRLYRWTW